MPNCEKCKGQEKTVYIPYFLHEAEMSRCERLTKRLLTLTILLITLLFGTNAAWLVYESRCTDDFIITQEVNQDTDEGSNTFIGGDFADDEKDY